MNYYSPCVYPCFCILVLTLQWHPIKGLCLQWHSWYTSVSCVLVAWAPSLKSKLYFMFPWHSGEWFAQPSLPLQDFLIEILSPFPNTRTGIKDSNCSVSLCIPSIRKFIFKTKCNAVLHLLYQQNPNQCLNLRLPTACVCLAMVGGATSQWQRGSVQTVAGTWAPKDSQLPAFHL